MTRPSSHSEPDAGSSTDEDLAACAQIGSHECFEELVRRYEGRIYSFLLRRVGSATDADDLAQETFVRAWRHIRRFDPRRRFSTWIFTIAVRRAASLARDRQRVTLAGENHHGFSREPDPAHAAGNSEPDPLWADAAKLLTPVEHAGLWLQHVEGLTPAEVALALGRSRVGVRVMLHRARQRLASRLPRPETHDVSRDGARAQSHSGRIPAAGAPPALLLAPGGQR